MLGCHKPVARSGIFLVVKEGLGYAILRGLDPCRGHASYGVGVAQFLNGVGAEESSHVMLSSCFCTLALQRNVSCARKALRKLCATSFGSCFGLLPILCLVPDAIAHPARVYHVNYLPQM